MRRLLSRRWWQLDDDEQGAAMTEFAMTLPIFLLFFGALLGLANMTHGAIDAHADAAVYHWMDTFYADQHATFYESGTEGSGVMYRDHDSGDYEDFNLDGFSNVVVSALGTAQVDGGHWQESQMVVDGFLSNLTNLNAPMDMVTDATAEDMLGDSLVARAVADDRRGQGVPDGDYTDFGLAWEAVVNEGITTNAGWAAGTRYGVVATQHEIAVNPGFGLPVAEYEVTYFSKISPTPHFGLDVTMGTIPDEWWDEPETRSWFAVRMWADEIAEYGRLFEIDTDQATGRLDHNRRTVVTPWEE